MSGATENDLGKLATAKFADGRFNFIGEIIGYAAHPTLIIRLADGSQAHWAAHLTEVHNLSPEEVQALVPAPPSPCHKESRDE